MNWRHRMHGIIAVSVLACLISVVPVAFAPAHAQAARTWVSGVGDDANPCSRTAPCKTFAGAISKTAANGEISVLDPGGFGAVTITKPISIVAAGSEGGILASGTSGIIVNAGPSDNVSIRGLVIEGGGTGTNGIRVLSAGNVFISHTVIRGFLASPGFGVDVSPATAGPRVHLRSVEIYGNLVGIHVHSGSGSTGVQVESSTIAQNVTNSAVADTNTSVIRAQGSDFANSPLILSNGAQLVSNGNNFYAGGSSPPTTLSPLQ